MCSVIMNIYYTLNMVMTNYFKAELNQFLSVISRVVSKDIHTGGGSPFPYQFTDKLIR